MNKMPRLQRRIAMRNYALLLAVGASSLLVTLLPAVANATGEKGIPGCPGMGWEKLSSVEFMRVELGGWYVHGSFSPSRGVVGTYGGGGGGIRINCGMLLGHWIVLDTDYRLAASQYGNKDPTPDFGVEVGLSFAGARWKGRVPGSFVFGAGGGASLGRPIWFGLSASIYPMGIARFMLKPSRDTRIQVDYRIMPISSQYRFYAASVFAHDLAISAGYQYWHGGIRARLEDIYLHREPNHDYRSYWIGPFLAFTGL